MSEGRALIWLAELDDYLRKHGEEDIYALYCSPRCFAGPFATTAARSRHRANCELYTTWAAAAARAIRAQRTRE